MRKLCLKSAVALMAALPVAAACATVELYADAEVRGTLFRLKDIARVTGEGSERLSDIKIGVAPYPGHRLYLSQAQVARVLERKAPDLRRGLQWSGSAAVTVRSTGTAIESQRLTELATGSLKKELQGNYDKFEITPVGSPRETTLPDGVEIRVRSVSGKLARRTAVWLDLYANGRAYAAIPVWFSVQAWKPVPVAQRDIAAGSELQEQDFLYEPRDVFEVPNTMEKLPAPGNFRLRTSISRGASLIENAIEMMPAVSRNQHVSVRLASGNIVINTSGLAQENGRIGETIAVKNLGSSEVFLAKVTEPSVVTVDAR